MSVWRYWNQPIVLQLASCYDKQIVRAWQPKVSLPLFPPLSSTALSVWQVPKVWCGGSWLDWGYWQPWGRCSILRMLDMLISLGWPGHPTSISGTGVNFVSILPYRCSVLHRTILWYENNHISSSKQGISCMTLVKYHEQIFLFKIIFITW
jgi:hypothetical protein